MKYTTVFLNTHYITADMPKSSAHLLTKDGILERTTTTVTTDGAKTSSAQTSKSILPLLLLEQQLEQQHRLFGDARSKKKKRKADVYLKCKNWPQQLVLPDNTNAAYCATEPLSSLAR